jgi:hypothetical protein
MTPQAAVRFRGKTFVSDYHADALADCIECRSWKEDHATIARIIDEELEPVEFGYWVNKRFSAFTGSEAHVRSEWYIGRVNPL